MTLIDTFNTFQKVAKVLKLSANARSLYIAILGEFNSAMYPEALNLSNDLLRDISGVNSESSFHSARNALINAKLIRHKKQVYKLTPDDALEKLHEHFEKLLEPPCSKLGEGLEETWSPLGGVLEFPNTTPMPIEKEEEKTKTTTTTARAREGNGANSVEVRQMWFRCEGQQIPGSMIYALYELEKLHGTENLCKAILTASQNNKENRLTLNFLKAVLEKQLKGGNKKVGTSEPESWESQQPAWL